MQDGRNIRGECQRGPECERDAEFDGNRLSNSENKDKHKQLKKNNNPSQAYPLENKTSVWKQMLNWSFMSTGKK